MNLYTTKIELDYRREELLKQAHNQWLAREAMKASGQSKRSFFGRVVASIAALKFRPARIQEREAANPASVSL